MSFSVLIFKYIFSSNNFIVAQNLAFIIYMFTYVFISFKFGEFYLLVFTYA